MMNIKQELLKNADKDYQKFSQGLIPNINNVLGVRLPVLRKIAKEVFKNEDLESFLKSNQPEYMEEVMLQGILTGFIKKEPKEILEYVKDFIPKIDNWPVCDCFCSGLKFTEKNKPLVWKFIQPYFNSDKEYEIRFAYVMLLDYFIDEEYVEAALSLIDKFRDTRYYAQMAAAWALSVCYIKFPDKTLEYLKTSNLDKWTFNKAVQKICESLRVEKSTKNMLKYLKRK